MLNKVDIQVDNEHIPKEELKVHIRQQGNLRIFGFMKFHLGLYNLSSRKRDNDWLKRIGQAPVIYEKYLSQRSVDQMNVYLRNKGYYNAVIQDSLIFNPRKPKVDQLYRVFTGKPYTIRNFELDITDPEVRNLIQNDSVHQKIRVNRVFDVDVLNAERNRITRLMKNHGYYQFNEDYINFVADSSLSNKQVDLILRIEDAKPESSASELHKRFRINKYFVNSDFISPHTQSTTSIPSDTVREGNYSFLYKGKPNYTIPKFIQGL